MTKIRAKKRAHGQLKFTYKKHKVKVLIDDMLFFNFLRRLHGRFWGITSMMGLVLGFGICFVIRPDLLAVSTALSDFGMDVKTAPYFAGSVFFASYGLWRWRRYLERTLKRTKPTLFLLTLTIIGLLLVALMPATWNDWTYKLHILGISIVVVSIGLTVVEDILLSKTRRRQNANLIRLVKVLSFCLIAVGGWMALLSTDWLAIWDISLLGEGLMLLGYFIWVVIKTYQGEEPRSAISRLIKRIVLVS